MMNEFGHKAHSGKGFHIDTWGAGPFKIEVNNSCYLFEDSDRFGPALLKQNGELRANPYPKEKHPFWNAHWNWRKQGREIQEGLCVWREPKPGKCQIVKGHFNNCVVAQYERV